MATKQQKKRVRKKKSNFTKATSGSGIKSVESYFEKMSPKEVYDNYSKVRNNLNFRHVVELSKARKTSDFYSHSVSVSNSDSVFSWLLALLNSKKKEVKYFLNKDKELTSQILRSNWSQAIVLIDEVSEELGTSLAFEKLRVALYDELNEPVDDIIDGFDNVIVKHILERAIDCSKDNELFEFEVDRTKKEIKKSSYDWKLKSLLLYHLYPYENEADIDYEGVIFYERESSLIDIVLMFDSMLCQAFNRMYDANTPEFKHEIHKFISRLSPDYPSPYVINLKRVLQQNVDIELYSTDYNIDLLDLFYEGKFDKLLRIVNDTDLYTAPFYMFEVIVRAGALAGGGRLDGLLCIIAEKMEDVINRSSKYSSSRSWLESLSYKYRSIKWFQDLGFFLSKEGSFSKAREREHSLKRILLGVEEELPEKASLYFKEDKEKYFSSIRQLYRTSSSLAYFELLESSGKRKISTNKIKGFSKGYSEGLGNLSVGNKKTAMAIFKELAVTSEGYRSLESEWCLIKILLEMKSYEKAVAVFLKRFFINRDSASYFDLSFIIDSIGDSYKHSSNIDFPIILSIYSEVIDAEYDAQLSYSFELFLEYNNHCSPVNLFNSEDIYGKEKLHYFLEFVSSRDVLTSYIEFDSTAQVDACRVKICRYLIDRGVKSIPLSAESKELEQKKLLRRVRDQVNSSRIYVDTGVFLGRESTQFRSLFSRYSDVLKEGTGRNENEDAFEEAYEICILLESQGRADRWANFAKAGLINKKLPQRLTLFLSLLTLFREFYVNGDKGLNNYLSTRIRHGVLPTALREPFVNEGLYISSEKEFLLLEDNDPIQRQLKDFSFELKGDVFNIIKDFSVGYENIIDLINNEYLQVDTLSVQNYTMATKKSKRLFNYYFTDIETYAVDRELSISPTYEEAVKVIVGWLKRRTETNLTKVKTAIRDEVATTVQPMIDELKTNLRGVENSHAIYDLCNAVERARGELDKKIEEIIYWFNFNELESEIECGLKDAISIAKNSLGVSATVDFHGLEVLVNSRNIASYVDIFSILFENALSKSGLPKNQISLSVNLCSIDNDMIELTVSNYCSDLVLSDIDVSFYKEAYGDEDLAREVVQSEGGTGFFKIWKLIEKDLGIRHSFDVGISGKRFFVKIALGKTEGMKWNESSFS